MDYKRTLKFVGAVVGLLFFGAAMVQLAPTEASDVDLEKSLTDESLLRVDLDLQLVAEQSKWSDKNNQIDVQEDVLKALKLELREIEKNGAGIRKLKDESEERTKNLLSFQDDTWDHPESANPTIGTYSAAPPIIETWEIPTVTPTSSEVGLCFKHTAGEDQNQYVRYAAEISNNDLDFLCTLDGENGNWDPNLKAYNGEPSYGFCQHHMTWFSHIINDERFFTDPFWQLDQCYERYLNGTPLYGKSKCWKTREYFTCPASV